MSPRPITEDELNGFVDHSLVMLARPMRSERDMPMVPHADGDLNGLAWADRGLGHSLVGAVMPNRLHPLADEVRRQIRSEV